MRGVFGTVILASLLLVTTCLGAGCRAVTDDRTVEVDERFARYDSIHTPGAALAIIQDGEIVYKRGYGMANFDYGVPITPSSVFRIGSVSKQFTAFCIALLAREGKVGLDDSVTEYVPELSGEVYGEVRLRHLVHHTSGIRDYLDLQWLRGISDEGPYTPEEAIEVLSWQRSLNFPPGERYLYSNSGYLLLGMIVERISGQSLAEFAQERIFGPLGMDHTHFHDDHTRIVPNRATGYAPREDGGWAISTTNLDIVGDGSVFTTVEDLALWDRVFYEHPFGHEIMEVILTPGVLNDGGTIPYAFGLRLSEYRGLRVIRHGGGYVGYEAEMIRFPEQRFSVVCLMITAEGDPETLSRRVTDIYLANEFPEEAKPEDEKAGEDDKNAEITVGEADLASYIGRYSSDELRISCTLEVVDSELRVRVGHTIDEVLEQRAIGRFEVVDWMRIEFARDAEGAVTGFELKTEGAAGLFFKRE
jgi:CubicO group peptidase (beta-lactamase class C family)